MLLLSYVCNRRFICVPAVWQKCVECCEWRAVYFVPTINGHLAVTIMLMWWPFRVMSSYKLRRFYTAQRNKVFLSCLVFYKIILATSDRNLCYDIFQIYLYPCYVCGLLYLHIEALYVIRFPRQDFDSDIFCI